MPILSVSNPFNFEYITVFNVPSSCTYMNKATPDIVRLHSYGETFFIF